MARFLLVLKPRAPIALDELISGMEQLLGQLEAEIDHRTPAHLSAMVHAASDNLRLQLFADVQSKARGPVLELVMMSPEAMGSGAPMTRRRFEQLVAMADETMPHLEAVFRSDRDGPLPDRD